MWELINANKRKSLLLFILMGITLIALGYFLGNAFYPPDGGILGLFIAAGIWFLLSLLSYFAGDSILLSISKAKEVTPSVHPQLFNIVEEMKIAGNLPAMPKIYIIDEPAPNAFATGRDPQRSSIAVTAGLLSELNRDELQGVVAHEMSHILNRDILFMTFAGVMLGTIVIISEVFLRSMWYSGGSARRYRSSQSSRGGGQAQMLIIVIAIALAILAPIMARILYFAISRKREYLADASAVRLTRYPEGLAGALEKISHSNIALASANKATAPLYISNPFKSRGQGAESLFSTHPPIEKRIKILRAMSHGANYEEYQKAYNAQTGTKSPLIPSSALKDKIPVPLRSPSTEAEKIRPKKRQLGDLLRTLNKFAFLTCTCGLVIKIPPDFKKRGIACPRCGQVNDIEQVSQFPSA